MGCESMFYTVLITISVALITYNILISSTARVRSGFPSDVGSHADAVVSFDPVIRMPRDAAHRGGGERRLFHTAVTASQGVYNAWQCRIMYYWFKKLRDSPGGSEMGGFTRILHSGKPDSLMHEMPTFVADPLPAGTDQDIWTRKMIGGGFEGDRLYYINVLQIVASAMSIFVDPKLWHCHLGHPFTARFRQMFPNSTILVSPDYEAYQLGKHHRVSFSSRENKRSKSPFDLVHCDIWGPCRRNHRCVF